jgi:hypothetical protein
VLVSTSRSDELDVLGDSDCLTFVEHAEPIALFDPEVLDRVLRFVPALDVRTFVHDQGAEVPRVEHALLLSHKVWLMEHVVVHQNISRSPTLKCSNQITYHFVIGTIQSLFVVSRARCNFSDFGRPHRSWPHSFCQPQAIGTPIHRPYTFFSVPALSGKRGRASPCAAGRRGHRHRSTSGFPVAVLTSGAPISNSNETRLDDLPNDARGRLYSKDRVSLNKLLPLLYPSFI